MSKQIHDLIQGSDEWKAFRLQKRPASLVAGVMGISPYITRTEILRIYATGIPQEIDEYVERVIFAEGHRVEPLAREIIERDIGDELSPVVYSADLLSASVDGITFDESIGFECKQWNDSVAKFLHEDGENGENGSIPDYHMAQVQQCLLVTGAEKWIFTISNGTKEKTDWITIWPSPYWFDRIKCTWAQFEIDLANYAPIIHDDKPLAAAQKELPALFIHARGEITTHNMQVYGAALTEKLVEVRSIVLVDDKDFANANKAAKDFREQIEKLQLVKSSMLEQTTTIGEAARMIDEWCEDLRVTALQLEKDVKREDAAKKEKIVLGAKTAYQAYLVALELEISPIRLNNISAPNFADAIARKHNYNSMQNGVDTMLANEKINADAVAKDLRDKLAWIDENAADYRFLLNDLQIIIHKSADDFKLLVTTRIEHHKVAEFKKAEELRERIALEEKAKAEEKIRQEQAESLQIERARVNAETKRQLEEKAAKKSADGPVAKQEIYIPPASKNWDEQPEKTDKKIKSWYGDCGSLVCASEINGITQKLDSVASEFYGAGYFIGESMLEPVAKIISDALGLDYQGRIGGE